MSPALAEPGARMTLSTAAQRRRARGWRTALEPARLVPLSLTLAVTLVGLALVFVAKHARMRESRAAVALNAVRNLNRVGSAAELEPALERILPDPGDRRFAAERIFASLPRGGAERPLMNVGTIGALRVPAREVMARNDLGSYRERAADALAAHRPRPGRDVAPSLVLVTFDQLQTLKPWFVVRDAGRFLRDFAFSLLLYLAAFVIAHFGLHAFARRGDRFLLPVVQLLSGLGLILTLSLRDPVRDQMLFVPFSQGVFFGALAMVAVSLIRYERSVLGRFAYLPLLLALALSATLVIFGSGPGVSDAKVNLLGVQPIEAIRLLIVLFLAGYFAPRWHLLRELDERPLGDAWWQKQIRLPRFHHVLPVAIGVAACIAFFFLQKDLGPALILVALFLTLYGLTRRDWVVPALGFAAVLLAFTLSASIGFPRTVALRTAMWLSPWENGATHGDQVAHALWGFAAGGLSGTGLGLGSPSEMPAAHTDLVVAALGEELGFAGVLAVFGLYALLFWRGWRIARAAPDHYTMYLALGLILSLIFPLLLIAGGVLGLAPLSGVVNPFLSYGRSALIMHFAYVGILWSISASIGERGEAHADSPARPFDRPLFGLAVVLAVLGGVLVLRAAWVQVVRGDPTLSRGTLVRDADGVRRYRDNPRLRQIAANLPRGDVLDRNGIVLAANRWDSVEKQRSSYQAMAIEIGQAPEVAFDRYYPCGGFTFHLIGDVQSRLNWGASNTSFVERDYDDRLRGYDDHAKLVTVNVPGGKQRVVRRDLRELVPLWRHRREPNHPAVRAVRERPRDLKLTIDARLQVRVARLLRERLLGAGLERGAVVALDVQNGDVIACASHPWPDLKAVNGALAAAKSAEATRTALADSGSGSDYLDRARYGRYPPGSTFKLVTAAAALGQDRALEHATFRCRVLGDRRVGEVVEGRPVRDDIGDEAHGQVAMELGTTVSCNAYFAQLGRKVGWQALERMGKQFGIVMGNPRNDAERRAHVIEASNGQAQVLATPLRMAGVAAAIAAEGRLAPSRWVVVQEQSDQELVVMPAHDAATLARFMRGVVQRGTARQLAALTPAIAGKTGTAEVADAPSHAWFIGYAPHGGSGRRVAVAVLLENGGYGGQSATRLAGEVVAAARALGIIG
jgi:cell division protein FtsW (lipid II flippase)/cell division protein FtsI/penicillin-binding protein 2